MPGTSNFGAFVRRVRDASTKKNLDQTFSGRGCVSTLGEAKMKCQELTDMDIHRPKVISNDCKYGS